MNEAEGVGYPNCKGVLVKGLQRYTDLTAYH